MKKEASSKSSLFLMEMMISILFFAVAAVVCIQIFAKAHHLSVQAENLNRAQGIAADAAERLAGGAEAEPIACYDREWRKLGPEEKGAAYTVSVTLLEEGQTDHISILVEEISGKVLYELNTSRYHPLAAKEGRDE